jgi:crotonobetainyl-CoA:carnitine CoA-transferase CaiB-like acyl-CoA transferase
LGADTEAVMKDLGYTDEQIKAAEEDGSIKGDTPLHELI